MPAVERGSRRIAFFISTLGCGGAERAVVNLLRAAADLGIPLDLLLARAEGPFLSDVPSEVRIIDFKVRKLQHAIPQLTRYLRQQRPHGVVSQITHANVALLIARKLARSKARVVVVEQSNFSATAAADLVRPRVRALARWLYPGANQIVAASTGVALDLEQSLGLSAGRVRVIHNPIVDAQFLARAHEPSPHAWLPGTEKRVLLSVGRLVCQKDQASLLRAFALLRQMRPVRLLIFGEGPQRAELEALCRKLNLSDDVALPGITPNPAAAMSRAALFVLSSRFEGFGNVLAEALACGCPVVSTDCPDGPAEILDHGRYGLLVPTENPQALASAMLTALDRNWDRIALQERGAEFSAAKSLAQYLDALDYSPFSAETLAAA